MTLLRLETMTFVQRNNTAAVVPQPLKDSDEHITTTLDCKTHICFKLIPVLNNEVKVTQVLSNTGEKGNDRC